MGVVGHGARSAGISLLVTGGVWTVWTLGADRPGMPPVVVWIAMALLGVALLASRVSRRG